MANPMRTVRVRFDGDAKGLTKAVSDGVKGIQKFSDDVRKNSRSGGLISGIVEGIKSGAGAVKDSLQSVFSGGLKGALSTPYVGPIILAALAAVAATVAPAAAALIGGAIVLGFGAGITGIGFKLLLENEKIKKQFEKDWASVKKTLQDAFKPLIPVLDTIRAVMKNVAKEFAPVIKQGAELAKGPLKIFVQQLGEAFKQLAPAIEPMMMAFGELLTAVGPYLVALFQLISDELVTMAGSMTENKDSFGLLVAFILTSIPFVLKVINLLIRAFTGIVNGVKAAWNWTKNAFTNIKNTVSSSIASVRSFISGGISFIRNVWSSGWNYAKNFVISSFNRIKSGVTNGINNAVSFVRSLPGKIKSAIGNLGSLLYQAGANVINGLIRGIQSRIAAVRSKISEVTQTIRNHLPFSPAKEGPLSGSGNPENSGRKIGQMLAEGIGSQYGTIRSAMNDVLSGGVTSTPVTATGSPNFEVKVFIGDQELKGMVRSEISESNRGIRRRALAA